jgi:hypothetical protein
MNTSRCLTIAERINAQLLRELQQGVDAERMLRDPLYTRDVLLVCDAFTGSDLASLAGHFRSAMAEAAKSEAGRAAAGTTAPSGASRLLHSLNSIFGPPSTLDETTVGPPPTRTRSWFGRSGARK